MVRQRAKTEAAWKNVGTHSMGSVAQQSDAATLPLRVHFFGLMAQLSGSWVSLAQNAHASYILRHIIHLLQGEVDIQALAADPVGASSSSRSSSSSSSLSGSALVAPTTGLPSYLLGLEELLPWVVQEVCSAGADEVEAVSRSASGAPVLAALGQAMAKLQGLFSPGETASSQAMGLTAALAEQTKTLLAKIVQLEGMDPELWTPEACNQTAKKSVDASKQHHAQSAE